MYARFLLAASLVIGCATTVLPGPAAAADDRCFDPARITLDRAGASTDAVVVPSAPGAAADAPNAGDWPIVVSDQGTPAEAVLAAAGAACADVELTFSTPLGVRRVPLTMSTPDGGARGSLVVRPADAGSWRLTDIRVGTVARHLAVPKQLWVLQKVVVLLDHLTPVPRGSAVTVAGTVSMYSRDSVPVPFTGQAVVLSATNLEGYDPVDLGTVRTDSRGRFALRVTAGDLAQIVRATVPGRAPYSADTDTTMLFGGSLNCLQTGPACGIQLLSALQVPALYAPTTVTGRSVPGGVTVVLEAHEKSSSRDSWHVVASKLSDPDGMFRLTYRPNPDIPSLMRVRVEGTELPDEYEVQPAHRTSLSGRTGGTHTTIIRPGTKMSSFGRLNVTYNSGATGGYANQSVVVQTRSRGVAGALFTTVATARTTSTGYFYANWTARRDVDVRVAYFSPYRTVQWAFAAQGIIDVR